MIEAVYERFYKDKEHQGALSFVLLLVVVWIMIIAVLDVGWVREDTVIIPAALIGLILGAVLAKRPLPAWMAWALIVLYGLLIVTLTLARLWPPLSLLFRDWGALRIYWLENGAEFLDRTGSWISAMAVGGRSNETIVFAFIMGMAAWFLAAYAAWSAYRQRLPLLGLILMGLAIAVNGYYGAAPGEWAVAFVGVAVLTTAVLHFDSLEHLWQENHVDYSREIRLEMYAYAVGIGATLLAFSYLIPSINPSRLALLILGQPAVSALEEDLDRAFAGVEQPRGRQIPPGQAGGAGIMPRSFLLGNAPELEKVVMMTAAARVVESPSENTDLLDEADEGESRANINLARHWRALSYEVYTGRGWSLSEERVDPVPAGREIPQSEFDELMVIEQDVHWRYDNRVIRYSLGLPLSFDHNTLIAWRGLYDLVRAKADMVNQYQVTSRLSKATPEQLRTADLSDVPSIISERYTQLPDSLPRRVRDLAAEITADEPTTYDQARAIERFLRQYEYSLDVALPPEGVDPVDFFLFDLQEGYCDYYASSMVVLARSLGIPARLATGFLAQTPDEDGQQTIRQINAHSWAEVYFPQYGWVEFEPTAPFISPHDVQFAPLLSDDQEQEPDIPVDTMPIPEREPQREIPWQRLGWLAAAAAVLGVLAVWWRRRPKIDNDVERAYFRLQQNAGHLGHSLPASQTPEEFSVELLHRLEVYEGRPRLARAVDSVRQPIVQLTDLFNKQQYSGEPIPDEQTAVTLWQRIRRPLWLLRLAKRFKWP